MALIVSGALIFTLTKLFEKIREGSSGCDETEWKRPARTLKRGSAFF
jgi:hypothetical protein